jgi:hypothetical protein
MNKYTIIFLYFVYLIPYVTLGIHFMIVKQELLKVKKVAN